MPSYGGKVSLSVDHSVKTLQSYSKAKTMKVLLLIFLSMIFDMQCRLRIPKLSWRRSRCRHASSCLICLATACAQCVLSARKHVLRVPTVLAITSSHGEALLASLRRTSALWNIKATIIHTPMAMHISFPFINTKPLKR